MFLYGFRESLPLYNSAFRAFLECFFIFLYRIFGEEVVLIFLLLGVGNGLCGFIWNGV